MSSLIWVTDPHLNFLGSPYFQREGGTRFGSPFEFGHHLRTLHPECAGVVISGDIGEANSVERVLQGFQKGYGGKVYYVLGNHDFYGGSFETVFKTCREITNPNLIWMREAGVIELSPTVGFVGDEGWYDGRAADPFKSNVLLSDFSCIKDFKGRGAAYFHQQLKDIAADWAQSAMVRLREACQKYPKVLFMTHVPPFVGAAWHEGEPSDSNWLPWMCNVTLGDALLEVAYDFQQVDILTICGHTHSPGDYKEAPNLRVMTGVSKYGSPCVSGVLDLVKDL